MRRRNFEKERLQEGESHIKISQKTREKSRVQESRVQDFFLQSPVKCKTLEDNAYFEFGYLAIYMVLFPLKPEQN